MILNHVITLYSAIRGPLHTSYSKLASEDQITCHAYFFFIFIYIYIYISDKSCSGAPFYLWYHSEVPNARLQLHFPYTSLGISRYHALILVPDRAHDPHDGTKPCPHVRSGRWRGIHRWIRHFSWRGREPDLDVRPVGTRATATVVRGVGSHRQVSFPGSVRPARPIPWLVRQSVARLDQTSSRWEPTSRQDRKLHFRAAHRDRLVVLVAQNQRHQIRLVRLVLPGR